MRRTTSIWLVVIVVGLGSLVAATVQLWNLPELSIYLSPDLRVRSVSTTFTGWDGSTNLKRGDRVDAVEGQSVDTLADVRAILRALPAERPPDTNQNASGSKTSENTKAGKTGAENRVSDVRMIDVQVRRPLHRFTIALQREDANSRKLPPGYIPETDKLLEVDGHPLPDPVGTEQLRSIIASESQALLTFGRKGAIFQADLPVRRTGFPWVPVTLFICAIAATGILWRRHAQEHAAEVAAAIGLETIAFGWIGLLGFAYQWILADRMLATAIIASMCLVRPLAMFARSRGPTRDANEGWWSLAIGGGFAVLLGILLHVGPLTRIEIGLFAGASVGALAVVYEISVLGFDEGAPNTLAEGGGYLVAVLVAAFICAFLAWLFEPVLFKEQLWRWFAVGTVGLVWFGDVLFTLRGPLSSTYGNVVSVEERRQQIVSYLDDIGEKLPYADVQIVVRRAGRSVGMRSEMGTLSFEEPDEHLRDAIDILVQEDSRIPLPASEDRSNHPLTGIALSMDIVLAMQLHPPEFGLILPNTDVVVVATESESSGDVPEYASDDAIDFVQGRLDARTWVAVFAEGVRGLEQAGAGTEGAAAISMEPVDAGRDGVLEDEDGDDVDDSAAEDRTVDDIEDEAGGEMSEAPEEARQRIEQLEEEIENLEDDLDEEKASNEMLREDRRDLTTRLQHHQQRWRTMRPPVDKRDELLEDDLLESMSYLIEDPEPIVVGGPYAGGKRYMAHCLADMEEIQAEAVVEYEASRHAPGDHHAYLLEPDEESNEERDPMEQNFAAVAEGGMLVVSSADLMSDSVLLALCNRVEDLDTRLVLCFHDAEAHEHSVLEDRPNNVVNRLGHRELVIPPVVRRPSILEAVFEHYLEQFSIRIGTDEPELSEDAVDWLTALSYPAQMREVQLWMHRIVLEADSDVIEPADLPEPIRPPDGAPGA